MKDTCQNCKKRPATTNWVGEGSTLEYVHGFYQRWCDYCVIKAQIKHCKKMARAIPSLEKKLKKLK